MKKHVLILLTAVCCWIFLMSGDVFSAHRGGGGGRWGGGGRGHVTYHGAGGHAVYHGGSAYFNDTAVEGSPCVWNGWEYQCYENDDND